MKREWTVHVDPESGDGFAAVQDAVMDLTTCLTRLGGVGAISPLRQGVRDGEGRVEYFNIGFHFKYDSYAPGINPDPEAVEAAVPVEALDAEEFEPTELVAVNGGGDEDPPHEGE
jgi:hypothetical protein